MFRCLTFLKTVLGSGFVKPANNRNLKIDKDVTLYDVQDGILNLVGSARISSAVVTNPSHFKRRFHGFSWTVDLVPIFPPREQWYFRNIIFRSHFRMNYTV